MEDSIKSIATVKTSELKVKDSRFIATVSPAENLEAALDFIRSISAKFHDATHNCFAYRVGLAGSSTTRYNDDGEPPGTAGKPILMAIESKRLNNLVLVVTRYFGGTKLGTGGLARAYSEAARSVLELSKIVVATFCEEIEVDYPYGQTNTIGRLINQFGCSVCDSVYTDRVKSRVLVPRSVRESFVKKLNTGRNGEILWRTSGAKLVTNHLAGRSPAHLTN